MAKGAAGSYRQPPAFPGFDDYEENPDVGTTEVGQAGEPESPGGGEQLTGEEGATGTGEHQEVEPGKTGSEAVQLADDTLVVDPADGKEKAWKEIKDQRLFHADWTRKTQALAPSRNMVNFYEKNKEFRKAVDEAGKRIYAESVLGVKVAPDEAGEQPPAEPTPEEREALLKRFDDDPFAVLDERDKRLAESLKPEPGVTQEDLQRIKQEATMQGRIDSTWDDLRSDLGDDFKHVMARVQKKADQMDDDTYQAINRDPARTRRLVKETYRDLLKERGGARPPSWIHSRRSEPRQVGADKGSTDTPVDDSPWSWSDEKFKAKQREVRGFG